MHWLSQLFGNSDFDKLAIKRPIFVWGAPRSGTTLVYQSLAQHPQLVCPRTETGDLIEGAAYWWNTFGEERGAITADQVTGQRKAQVQRAYAQLLPDDEHRLLDKTPFMTLWIEAIDVIFPDAYHIHIIRDGRAVVNSILYKLRHSKNAKDKRFMEEHVMYGPQPPEIEDPLALHPAERHARQWVSLVQTGRAQRVALGERYYEVRYEDLVSRYRDGMRDLFNYAELAVSDDFLATHYATALENRNYKRHVEAGEAITDGWTGHSAIREEDLPHLQCMTPLLEALGYSN
jgi:hypothetical protein